MEDVLKIISGTVIGTTLMTIFSYFAANKWNSPFREPVLLNKLLYRAPFYKSQSLPMVPGWILHYSVGAAFMIIYHLLWIYTSLNPNLLTGLVLGFFSGFIGIASWFIFFKIHPDPPFTNSRKYYTQLLFAHIIFGAGAVLGYQLFNFE